MHVATHQITFPSDRQIPADLCRIKSLSDQSAQLTSREEELTHRYCQSRRRQKITAE